MANNLKIISGKYRGLTFDGDNIVGTRPTMNRVKESVFGMIQNHLKNSVCLDLFAGSGNLGLEALSNGAKTVYFVDHNKIATDTIVKNIKKLRILENYYIFNEDYESFLKRMHSEQKQFDIIFLDPPYTSNLITNCLCKITEYDLLQDNGIIVCEYEGEDLASSAFKVWKERTYGSKKIVIYQK